MLNGGGQGRDGEGDDPCKTLSKKGQVGSGFRSNMDKYSYRYSTMLELLRLHHMPIEELKRGQDGCTCTASIYTQGSGLNN